MNNSYPTRVDIETVINDIKQLAIIDNIVDNLSKEDIADFAGYLDKAYKIIRIQKYANKIEYLEKELKNTKINKSDLEAAYARSLRNEKE